MASQSPGRILSHYAEQIMNEPLLRYKTVQGYWKLNISYLVEKCSHHEVATVFVSLLL